MSKEVHQKPYKCLNKDYINIVLLNTPMKIHKLLKEIRLVTYEDMFLKMFLEVDQNSY